MAEESIQEQTTTKNKKDFSKAVSKVGKSLGNFIKSLYGKKIDTEQGETPGQKPQTPTTDQPQAPTTDQPQAPSALAKLVSDKINEIKAKTGIRFNPIKTEKGEKLVLIDTEGKNRGGAFPTKANLAEGRIDGKTSFQGKEFIDKDEALDLLKLVGDEIQNFDVSEKIAQKASEGGEKMPDQVPVKQGSHVVSLSRAITTTLVAALLASSITGLVMTPKDEKMPEPQPDNEIVITLPSESKTTHEELAEGILDDLGSLIGEHGEIAKDIKGYNQEKWEERRLSGGQASTTEERVQNEKDYSESIERRDEFNDRLDDIKEDYENKTISEAQYLKYTLELAKEVYVANAGVSKDCLDSINGALEVTKGHIDVYYTSPSEGRDRHEMQLKEYESDITSTQSNIDYYTDMAEQYSEVIKTIDKHPDLGAEDIKMLFAVQKEAQTNKLATKANNATTQAKDENAMSNTDEGMVQ